MCLRGNIIVAIAISGLGAGAISHPAMADSHGNKYVHSRAFNGQVYVMYQDHMSLYTYDKDKVGVSNCIEECTVTWKPALLEPGTGLGQNYTLIKREDGSMQAAFRGKPLYLYAGDKRPGDITGDGVDGMWRLARP